MQTRNELLESPLAANVIAQSAAMRPVLELIQRVGPSMANVLITGEHGTGKEVVARALHAISPRAARPMICVNAGSIPEALFESELFGHVRGAFTGAAADRPGRFELADQGTLLLDEIGNLPLAQQAKLLRAVESGEFERLGSPRVRQADVRLISATNSDLAAAVAAGAFREDLLFRLNTVHIHLPPLRERGDDILLLAHHFLEQHAVKSPDARSRCSTRARSKRCTRTAGRAMCASCSTSWSAPCYCAAATRSSRRTWAWRFPRGWQTTRRAPLPAWRH